MDRLTPAARALLDLARDGHDATPAQRTRADAAVRIGLALHGVTDLPPLDPPVHGPHPAAPPSIHPPEPAPQVASTALSQLHWTASWKLAAAGSALLFAGLFAARSARPLPHAAQPSQPVSTAPAAVPAGAIVQTPLALPAGVTEPDTMHAAAAAVRRQSSAPALRGATSFHALAAARTHSTRVAPALRGGAHLPASRSQVATSAVSEADLQAEVALIGAADELIRAHHYDGALRVLASHAQRFPRGALREERDALRLLAQCGNGLDARSERAVQRFLRTEPHSVVAQRMREACVASESP